MVACPACGYEFPPESKLLTLITKLVRRSPPPPPAAKGETPQRARG